MEGILEGTILCLSEDEERQAFAVKKDVPFRGFIEIPDAQEGMRVDCQIGMKDLWADKVNGKQAEINGSFSMEVSVIKETTLRLIKNPCFMENSQSKRPAAMVICVTEKNDNIWKIAKRYKTSIDTIKNINEISDTGALEEGTRLLIVK